jgi:hypothetical protein
MLMYLLDKNVARKTIVGIGRVERGMVPRLEEVLCLLLLCAAEQGRFMGYITPETFNILRRMRHRTEVPPFLTQVEVMQAGRYFKQWARRLREHGFTREDANVLALGTFGYDPTRKILGTSAIVTLDHPFINNYEQHRPMLARRLSAMTRQFAPPFRDAALPELWTPAEALATFKAAE